jgi:hypothetical protein
MLEAGNDSVDEVDAFSIVMTTREALRQFPNHFGKWSLFSLQWI